jgi:Zn-dependent M28 family amino/carboxypeptidase
MLRTFRPLAAAVALAAMLALAQPSAAQKPYDDPVLERIRKDIFFLASPECEGRGIETKGIEKAAEYIAAAFQKAGLKPAMKDGSFFQPFDVKMGPEPAAPTAFTLVDPDGGKKDLKLDAEFAVMGFTRTAKAKGDLVFAGFGISAPELKYDDYKDLDVEGKVVIALRRTPRYGETGDKRFDTTIGKDQDSKHASFNSKINLAVKNKAAALVVVNDTTGAGADDALPKYTDFAGPFASKIPVFMMKRERFDALLKAAGQKSLKEVESGINESLTPNSFALKGWSADAVVTTKQKEVACKNVVGVLEGSGPLKDETVVIGAHYDHVGYGLWGSAGGPQAAGKIHYGADDNASGTTGLMELARRFGEAKNRQGRRLVFIAFSGEEHGLDGSQHYCKNPLFPLAKTAAMINLDMIGRTKPVPVDWMGLFGEKDRLVIYGTGTGTGFDELAEETAKKADFRLFKVAASAGNSDNASFYAKKVPVLFLFTGLHNEYHRPVDVPEKIDVPGLKRVADVAEMMANELAARVKSPKFAAVATAAPLDPSDPNSGAPRRGPSLGIQPSYAYEGKGVLLEGVRPGGPAEKAGIKEGDVILQVAGKPTDNLNAYMGVMAGVRPGATIDVVVERKGQKLTLKAELK